MKNNVRKKPTAKEMASAIIEINYKTSELHKVTRQLDSILGLYIEMKGDKEKFNAYVDSKYKEHNTQGKKDDKKTNGKADKKDIPANPDNTRSRTEGIRKES